MLPKGLLKEYAGFLSYLLRGLDAAAVIIAGCIAYYYKFGNFQVDFNYKLGLVLAAFFTVIVFRFYGIYESIRAQSIWRHISHLLQAIIIVLMLLAGIAFLTKSGSQFSREWFIVWTLCNISLLVLFRLAMLFAFRLMRAQGWNERRVIIIGAGHIGQQLAQTVQDAIWTGFHIMEIFDDHTFGQTIGNIQVQKTPSDLNAYLKALPQSIDEIWIALPFRDEDRIQAILHELRHTIINTRYILDIFGLNLVSHSIIDLAGFPTINLRTTPMIGINRAIKACEDRLLSAIILCLISPVLLIIALLIKCTSKGPVFYVQKRVSWNGKEFNMLKFRSMPINAEANTGPVWAKPNEERATPLGKFLRRTSLDELPQFINVLKGDMSIVGPRPERLVFVEEFKDKIPNYMQKHLVKAGITGWAQVNGWRGNTSLEKRIEYDLYYIENWSLWFDLKIIFLTIFQGFINKNAY